MLQSLGECRISANLAVGSPCRIPDGSNTQSYLSQLLVLTTQWQNR